MNKLIEKMIAEKQLKGWSNDDVKNYIKKDFSIDENYNIILNGKFSIEELEAIIVCVSMERSTPKYD